MTSRIWRVQVAMLSGLLILLIAVSVAWAQAATLSSGSGKGMSKEISKEIIDPCLGTHWQLQSDPLRPGGPARVVLLGQDGNAIHAGSYGDHRFSITRTQAVLQPILIRPGQVVIVDQDLGVLHARLQAVALEPAAVGQAMKVRLRIAQGFQSGAMGAIIVVTATGPGTAQWSERRETQNETLRETLHGRIAADEAGR